MFYSFLMTLNFLNSSLILFIKHPLAMGLTLLTQTLLICLISGLMMKSFWFSYILFLIFLGGLLVLFIYVTSLASNEMFNFSNKIITFLMINFFLFTTLFLIFDKSMILNNMMSLENENLNSMKSFLVENSLTLNKLYTFPINLITILLMIYLFFTLIAVVKITNVFEGPLRPKNY
nr:NADH dehydrogenase subunit 6 [Limnophyes sp. YF-2022]